MPLDDLVHLRISHWDFNGEVRSGELIVAASVADEIVMVFRLLFEARFPIERMELVDAYGGDDDRSMAANNTSAFNCRPVTGGAGFSQHSFGNAIDINPVQNPYIRSNVVLPPAGAAFMDRTNVRPGMMVADGPVAAAFASVGWVWGGTWTSSRDYQHFSENGR